MRTAGQQCGGLSWGQALRVGFLEEGLSTLQYKNEAGGGGWEG